MRYKAKDIARELGVSPAAVSLVLNNKPGVGEEKRQEIMLLFTPVRQRKIITSRSILTIPIGIRMNFARGLSVMADGFTRICSSVMIPIKRV